MSAILTLEGLAAGYGDLLAVRAVSLEVREGECVALIGANGAGKTTTLRAISGLIPVRAGRAVFRGQPLAGLSPRRIVELVRQMNQAGCGGLVQSICQPDWSPWSAIEALIRSKLAD